MYIKLNKVNKNLGAVVVILIVVAVGGYLAYRSYKPSSIVSPATINPTPQISAPESSPSSEATSGSQIKEAVVKIASTGFDPKTIKIKAGGTVAWINTDNKTHNISSAPHPQHTTYPALNIGNIINGKEVTLAFPTKGTYVYHNHLFPTLTGSVIVE
ncbi:hypothetical protein A3H85_01715 [Candidatus Daviesbacteria bacterium RIFCSPLOWO2_02_FULL_40_8]|nr:MAG: hypothetical protein A2780_01070 [Candidatus Daviesbacteria bacterium RIFCSPHIGHO2_01_FULL_41_45]OGE35160.1 MAG: hypothetical protein A3C32_02450 [Candidatus Daviesbacteria bacterium RIFCSPHIGHO2_02_FULL_41_14]OGE66823.1 MAG: hypothetical protein A3H85_01715 [Candidatus Daviesbacteria bacterium RIFCSPLOWO2_02_FULL_40_8]